MRDRIEVDKELVPYGFDILLGFETYGMEFDYNKTAKLFTVTLSKNDEVLVYDEPIIYGKPLFDDLYQSGVFPSLNIIPYDESEQEQEVTYENFGEKVFLTIDGGDLSECKC